MKRRSLAVQVGDDGTPESKKKQTNDIGMANPKCSTAAEGI